MASDWRAKKGQALQPLLPCQPDTAPYFCLRTIMCVVHTSISTMMPTMPGVEPMVLPSSWG